MRANEAPSNPTTQAYAWHSATRANAFVTEADFWELRFCGKVIAKSDVNTGKGEEGILVSEDVIEWLLEPENPSMKYRTRALIPEDGYYVFELGVVNVNAYFPGKSVGFWTFSATVISP